MKDKGGSTPLNHLLDCDDNIREDIILVGIDPLMDIDLVFISSYDSQIYSGEKGAQLVVIQCKNRTKGTLAEVLVTLQPGCQYITKEERELLLKNASLTKRIVDPKLRADPKSNVESLITVQENEIVNFSGVQYYGSRKWKAFHDLLEGRSLFQKDWIRIGLVARKVAGKVYSRLLQFNEAHSSQIVLLNLSSGVPDFKELVHVATDKMTLPHDKYYVYDEIGVFETKELMETVKNKKKSKKLTEETHR
jgi:hypothetical protein